MPYTRGDSGNAPAAIDAGGGVGGNYRARVRDDTAVAVSCASRTRHDDIAATDTHQSRLGRREAVYAPSVIRATRIRIGLVFDE